MVTLPRKTTGREQMRLIDFVCMIAPFLLARTGSKEASAKSR